MNGRLDPAGMSAAKTVMRDIFRDVALLHPQEYRRLTSSLARQVVAAYFDGLLNMGEGWCPALEEDVVRLRDGVRGVVSQVRPASPPPDSMVSVVWDDAPMTWELASALQPVEG